MYLIDRDELLKKLDEFREEARGVSNEEEMNNMDSALRLVRTLVSMAKEEKIMQNDDIDWEAKCNECMSDYIELTEKLKRVEYECDYLSKAIESLMTVYRLRCER